MSASPQEIAYEKAHPDDYSAAGFTNFCIISICIGTVAVILRLWSRKLQRIQWQMDDHTLVVALILTIGSTICYILMSNNFNYGRHYYDIPTDTQLHFLKTQYAFNILYTVGYPLSRISLVLLYRRIFVQQWFRIICWIFVGIYAGYAISTALVDIFLTAPINAYWDHSITPRRSVNENKLYLANAGFNISTDCIMLILPLTIIWRLQMNWWHKIALSWIFALGALTMFASVVRLKLFFEVNSVDPTFSYPLSSFWTVAEQFLGILCPCLVTFRPLIRAGYAIFAARFGSWRSQSGYGSHYGSRSAPTQRSKSAGTNEFSKYADETPSTSDPDPERQSYTRLDESRAPILADSKTENRVHHFSRKLFPRKPDRAQHKPLAPLPLPVQSNDKYRNGYYPEKSSAPMPTALGPTGRGTKLGLEHTMASDAIDPQDAIALASLDPRTHKMAQKDSLHDRAAGRETNFPPLGTHTEAKAVPPASGLSRAPDVEADSGILPIEVQQELILERE